MEWGFYLTYVLYYRRCHCRAYPSPSPSLARPSPSPSVLSLRAGHRRCCRCAWVTVGVVVARGYRRCRPRREQLAACLSMRVACQSDPRCGKVSEKKGKTKGKTHSSPQPGDYHAKEEDFPRNAGKSHADEGRDVEGGAEFLCNERKHRVCPKEHQNKSNESKFETYLAARSTADSCARSTNPNATWAAIATAQAYVHLATRATMSCL